MTTAFAHKHLSTWSTRAPSLQIDGPTPRGALPRPIPLGHINGFLPHVVLRIQTAPEEGPCQCPQALNLHSSIDEVLYRTALYGEGTVRQSEVLVYV